MRKDLATKADLERLKLELTAEMVKINADTKADILKWVAGPLLAQAPSSRRW